MSTPIPISSVPDAVVAKEHPNSATGLCICGNALALTSLEKLVETDLQNRGIDPKRARIVFNGDFNWFNGVRRETFVSFNQRIMTLVKDKKAICIAGNIEAELGVKRRESMESSGCGCAYPSYVSDKVVSNSDKIMSDFLKLTAEADMQSDEEISAIVEWLGTLPYHTRLLIGPQGHGPDPGQGPEGAAGFRLGIVHGDATSLAGWEFAFEAMLPPDEHLSDVMHLHSLANRRVCGGRDMGDENNYSRDDLIEQYESQGLAFTKMKHLENCFQEAQVDCFACTHTCLPFMQNFQFSSSTPAANAYANTSAGTASTATAVGEREEKLLVNNGSAGMPNFRVETNHSATPVSTATTTGVSLEESECLTPPMSFGVITRISIPSTKPTYTSRSNCRDNFTKSDAGNSGGDEDNIKNNDIKTHITPPLRELYGTVVKGIHIDALSLPFNKSEYVRQFLIDHPEQSPAHDSYFQRITNGPNFYLHQANRINKYKNMV